MNENIRFPQGPIVSDTDELSLEWFMWLQNPQFVTLTLGSALSVISGGTGLTSGTGGGVLAFTDSDTIVSSGELLASHIVLGRGNGFAPSTLAAVGTATTVLHGNASGDPTWSAVSLTADVSGVLPVANGGTGAVSLTAHGVLIGNGTSAVSLTTPGGANTFLRGNAGADPSFGTAVLASADFANQGTTSTVLHGNAAGNPSFGAVSLTADVSGTLGVGNGGTGNTSGTATINANLTGPITSVGNATSVASQTGTGSTFVMDTSPTITGATVSFSGREQEAQGAVVASANNLVLGSDGNYFQISGSTQINLISSTGWQGGSQVTLKFNGNPSIKNNFGNSGVFKSLNLKGAVDYVTSSLSTLTLVYDSTDAAWYEVCRSVN